MPRGSARCAGGSRSTCWWCCANTRDARHPAHGDLPIYVAHDSADVWAAPELFKLDEQGRPRVVAGVPPDYFSATGQLWGNPIYDWDAMRADGSHTAACATSCGASTYAPRSFRGLAAGPCQPASTPHATAVAAHAGRGTANAIARDARHAVRGRGLGVITPDVEDLRRRLPGMHVMEFVRRPGGKPHLPHMHRPDSVVYTGTTTTTRCVAGWTLDEPCDASVLSRRASWRARPRDAARALASVARLAVLPMQDLLDPVPGPLQHAGHDERHWSWQLPVAAGRRTAPLEMLNRAYGR
jgi:4-alpha-glucanotransferase